MFRFIPDKPGGESDSDYASTLSPSAPVLSCLLRLLTMTGVGALSPFGAVFCSKVSSPGGKRLRDHW